MSALKSREMNPNYLRNQSVSSKGKAPGSGRVMIDGTGKGNATQRGTTNKNVKMIKGR